jgi:hypothetical protein
VTRSYSSDVKAQIAIVDGRRIVWHPPAAIEDVLDGGEPAPTPSPYWKFLNRPETVA